jgi:hypothetical protein
MSGPIVRSGPSPEFSRNWENVFGKKDAPPKTKKASAAGPKSAKGKPKSSTKSAAAGKKTPKKKK